MYCAFWCVPETMGWQWGTFRPAPALPPPPSPIISNFWAAAGVVTQEKQGRTILNRANYDHLRHLASYILCECCADTIAG